MALGIQRSLKIDNICSQSFTEQLPQWRVSPNRDRHTHSGITKSPCWPACGPWSVWIQYKLAASWSDGQWRPASADGARRRGLCLLWKHWLHFKTHTLRHRLKSTESTQKWKCPRARIHTTVSHTQLLSLLILFDGPQSPCQDSVPGEISRTMEAI